MSEPTFVAMTTSSWRPRAAIQRPMIVSDSPPWWPVTQREYESAVSIRLKPASTNASSRRNDVASSTVQPNTLPPNARGTTSNPVLPSLRRFIRLLRGRRECSGASQVIDQRLQQRCSGSVVRRTQDRCRMIRRDQSATLGKLQGSCTRRGDRHLLTRQREERTRAERHDDARLHVAHFVVEPVSARGHRLLRRRLVNPALAARLPIEMLDGVGDVDLVRGDTGAFERIAQQ